MRITLRSRLPDKMRALFVSPIARAAFSNPPIATSSPSPKPLTVPLTRRAMLLLSAASLALVLQPYAATADICPSPLNLSESEWRSRLSPSAFSVLRLHATEPPFSSILLNERRPGKFLCAGCGTELFSTSAKFDSGTGWPSFSSAIKGGTTLHSTSLDKMLLQREVRCATCDGHLGHVFRDGPPPTRERYCINGIALGFKPER